jgi:hypothetical protein
MLLALACLIGALMPATIASANTTWAHEGWTKVGYITLGGDIRIRWLNTENMSNMGTNGFVNVAPGVNVPLGAWNSIDIWRQRGRIWFKADLPKNITTYFRMTQEFYWGGDTKATGGGIFGNEDRWAMLLDNAWIQVARPWELPFTLKGGRMDMRYGECFLICDSDASYAGDGSRTFFFDAVKGTVHLDAIETNVDLIYSKIHEQSFGDGNDDDDLYGLYATCTAADPLKIEAYILGRTRRHQRLENVMWTLGVGINQPRRNSQTWGGRISGKYGVFSFAVEAAGQTGTIDNIQEAWIANTAQQNGVVNVNHYKFDPVLQKDRTGSTDILAYAGYAHADLNFAKVTLKPSFMVGYWFYSGDDRTSSKWGGFDDLWGQAPIHGEYYLYSHLDLLSSPNSDWDPYMHTNTHFPKLRISIDPLENMKFTTIYQAHFAHRNTQLDASYGNQSFTQSEGGLFRGHYLQMILGYNFSEHLSAHFRWELFFPGDYYPADAQIGQFGRVQFIARF